MPVCNPPLRQGQHQSKTGPPPPWWPTGSEDWWTTELLEHLDLVAALSSAPVPVPFAPSYGLKKPQKVAVLVAIVKHLAPDFARIAAAVRHSGKLSISETDLWHSALNNERAKYTRLVFILLPQARSSSSKVALAAAAAAAAASAPTRVLLGASSPCTAATRAPLMAASCRLPTSMQEVLCPRQLTAVAARWSRQPSWWWRKSSAATATASASCLLLMLRLVMMALINLSTTSLQATAARTSWRGKNMARAGEGTWRRGRGRREAENCRCKVEPRAALYARET